VSFNKFTSFPTLNVYLVTAILNPTIIMKQTSTPEDSTGLHPFFCFTGKGVSFILPIWAEYIWD